MVGCGWYLDGGLEGCLLTFYVFINSAVVVIVGSNVFELAHRDSRSEINRKADEP